MFRGTVGVLTAFFVLIAVSFCSAEPVVSPGIEVLLTEEISLVEGCRVGLVTNQTAVDSRGVHIADILISDSRINLVALYSPEHGIRGTAPAGVGVQSERDAKTGLPVYSLYGEAKRPTKEMLAGIDVLLFDIQDVGARFYTYIYTMAFAMEAAAQQGIKFIVLDRPNPIGGEKVEGPVLDPDFKSFVGMYPIPVRHGMTVGELALMFNGEFGIGADLTVVPMQGWERSMYFDETGLPWIKPSPNMVSLETAIVYPGTCLFEGTNVSEGRGTDWPFQLIGAPYIDGPTLARSLNSLDLPGVRFSSRKYVPAASKYKGVKCEGAFIEVNDRQKFCPVITSLSTVRELIRLYPKSFCIGPFFSLLLGTDTVAKQLLEGWDVARIAQGWQEELEGFLTARKEYLLY